MENFNSDPTIALLAGNVLDIDEFYPPIFYGLHCCRCCRDSNMRHAYARQHIPNSKLNMINRQLHATLFFTVYVNTQYFYHDCNIRSIAKRCVVLSTLSILRSLASTWKIYNCLNVVRFARSLPTASTWKIHLNLYVALASTWKIFGARSCTRSASAIRIDISVSVSNNVE